MAKDEVYQLEEMPPPNRLVRFESLRPEPPEKRRGLLRRLVGLPLRIVALPFSLIGRIFRRGHDDGDR